MPTDFGRHQMALRMLCISEMTNSAGAFFRDRQDDIQSRYQAISQDSRYGHYVRIPERICRCLDYFKISSSRQAVKERLHSYYLFIGVADDIIDSSAPEAGREILRHLCNGNPPFDEGTKESHAKLAAELLKCHISPDTYPAILRRLEELYQAVVSERKSTTMRGYIEQRKTIGCLTAEVSYLLIRPLLRGEHKDLRRFLQNVGEVGCLLDSAIDLTADAKLGLISFRPTLNDRVNLIRQLLCEGLKILLKHPRLLGLFLEAIADNLLDFRFRTGRQPAPEIDGTRAAVAGSCPALQMPGT